MHRILLPILLTPTTGPNDWKALLADPEKHWRQGYSAMSAALSWEDAQNLASGLPPEIAAVFGAGADLVYAIPEHKVALPGGGRASQCDVFALIKADGQTIAVAVEAKVSEPFGPNVGDWLNDASKGKVERLTAICALLGCAYPPPPDLRYQLFHRTAAAVLEAARLKTAAAAMVVQSFSPEHRWFGDFTAFCHYLGHAATRATAVVHTLPTGTPLTLAWVTGERCLAIPVHTP